MANPPLQKRARLGGLSDWAWAFDGRGGLALIIFVILLFVLLSLLVAAPFLAERARKPMDEAARRDAPGTFHELSQGVTHVTRKGPMRGPVIVCVHGLTSSEYIWEPITDALTEVGYRIVAYDLYGRGYSDRPEGVQDEDFFLRQLEEMLEEMEVPDSFILMGYSMGAAISVAYAEKNPGRVDQLVLIAPAGLSDAASGLDRWVRDTPVLGDWLSLTFGHAIRKKRYGEAAEADPALATLRSKQLSESEYRGYLPSVLSSARNMLRSRQVSYHQKLEEERVPTLAIWGEVDPVIPLTALGDMTQANRSVRHVTVPNADHSVVITHTDEIIDAIKSVLLEA